MEKFADKELIDLHISHVVKVNNLEALIEKLTSKTFNEKIILRLILIFSCCVFSIAAENRFISHGEISDEMIEQK